MKHMRKGWEKVLRGLSKYEPEMISKEMWDYIFRWEEDNEKAERSKKCLEDTSSSQ